MDPAAPLGVELGKVGRKTGMGVGTVTSELGTGICSGLACGSAGSHCHQALVTLRRDRSWVPNGH